jgi:hypothetical protein
MRIRSDDASLKLSHSKKIANSLRAHSQVFFCNFIAKCAAIVPFSECFANGGTGETHRKSVQKGRLEANGDWPADGFAAAGWAWVSPAVDRSGKVRKRKMRPSMRYFRVY